MYDMMISSMKGTKGFTLIELLVVIAIIGILASVILASLNTARKKAQYAKVVSELREMDKAFQFVYDDMGCWPREGTGSGCTFGSAGNPTIASLISSGSDLSKYLPSAPTYPFTSDGTGYHYDNEGDTFNEATCASTPANVNSGVGVYVKGDLADFWALDKIIDQDSDPNTAAALYCGKLLWTGTNIMYKISQTPN
jgi:prepilin-type N-terminal cleavage/methylation domain-containing protein